MPYVHCLTSSTPDAGAEERFKSGAAAALGEVAGKPEQYLFVALQGGQTLFLRGKRGRGAVIRISLVGALGKAQKKELAGRFCRLCRDTLSAAEEDVYVIFEEVQGENWGWSGGLFG